MLESTSDLSDKERKELSKLKQQASVDEGKLKAAEENARKDRDSQVNQYYRSEKFASNVIGTSALEGGKMGLQQAIGAVIAEFLVAVVDEIQDWYRSGRKEPMFKERFGRVSERVLGRWRDYLSVGVQGTLSGFLSNIVTVLINTLATTSKRLVRMIREGVFSLFRALKTVALRPEGTTHQEAFHEASKLAFAGAIVIGGIALEEYVVRQLQVLGLGLIADIAGAVVVGSITAVLTALLALMLDKIDLFGAEAATREVQVREMLRSDIAAAIEEAEQIQRSMRVKQV